MSSRLVLGLLPFFAALMLGAAPEAQAQVTTGRIQGSVVDSTMSAPLTDAAVFLWDTEYQAVTDSAGRFALDVPAGRYSVVFFHARLGELGISAGPQMVDVVVGQTVEVQLAIPSAHTLVASECLFEPEVVGVAVGQALDGRTGLPLGNAQLRFAWEVEDGGRDQREVQADAGGWYLVCNLPKGPRIAITATFLDRSSLRREKTLGDEPLYLDLALLEFDLTDVDGRLVDAETGQSISDASVYLQGTGFRTTTGREGEFRFQQVLPGSYTLHTEHLAYGERDDSLHLPAGVTVDLDVQLAQRAFELPPIVVSVEPEDIPQRAMGGTVISPSMIDDVRTHSRDALDLIRNQNIPGLIIRRQAGNTCIGFMQGQVRMNFRAGCVPAMLFIDNVRMADPQIAIDLPADVIDRIVLYRPIEAGNLFGLGAGNGVVMIFTKSR